MKDPKLDFGPVPELNFGPKGPEKPKKKRKVKKIIVVYIHPCHSGVGVFGMFTDDEEADKWIAGMQESGRKGTFHITEVSKI